jgi:serralysin
MKESVQPSFGGRSQILTALVASLLIVIGVSTSGTASAAGTSYSCQRNWYVSQNGSDRASGNSSSAPWQTIQHASDSGQLRAGDCVNVANGTYSLQSTLYLNQGGNANSSTGYVVYRSINQHGAKIRPAYSGFQDVVVAVGNYIIVDGFEIDGGNEGLTSSPVSWGTGLGANGHHFQALNNLVHDCGGGGIGASYSDWYWIVGNTVYNNAHFNGYQMSGISVYEPRQAYFNATSADNSATYHITIQNNVTHDNAVSYVGGSHTDGNGLILDDFQNTQSGYGGYPYKALVQSNTSYNNGGSGIFASRSNNVTIDSNTAYNNNLDTANPGTWRGDLANEFSSNNSWTNNRAAATSLSYGPRASSTAIVDCGGDQNVTWSNNANYDTRTGGRSYRIDVSSRASAFPSNNPLGGSL